MCNLITLTDAEKRSLLLEINDMPLEFRSHLNIPDDITYATEIEVNSLQYNDAKNLVIDINYEKDIFDNPYSVSSDPTVESEINTPILTNSKEDWITFDEVYASLRDAGATIGGNTSSHIHYGTHVLKNVKDLSLLIKTLVVFEDIIYLFGYGLETKPREFITASTTRSNFSVLMTPKRVKKFVSILDNYDAKLQREYRSEFRAFTGKDMRYRPVFNFRPLDFEKYSYDFSSDASIYDHAEVRCFNGTLNQAISQNNINLVTNIIFAVIDGRIDKEYIEKEYRKYVKRKYNFDCYYAEFSSQEECEFYNTLLGSYSKFNIDKAFKLADMIFTKDIDKYYFLKQYLKLFDKDDSYVLSLTA